jgi:translation initiation factor IF-2
MGAVTSKVRIYDLAKELKIDTKRLIEEVRREGVDVSVPSNSVSNDLADKIRNKYFPKKDAVAKRAIKVVKKAARPVVDETPPEPAEEIIAAAPAEAEAKPAVVDETESPAKVAPTRVVRKLSPPVRVEKAEEPIQAVAEPEETEIETESEPIMDEAGSPPPPRVEPPPAHQVRVMRPTAAALSAGIRHGERAPAPPVPVTAAPVTRERSRERTPRERVAYAGTPGETATPQTTYIPPPDAGRRRSRRGSTRGGKRGADGKGGRIDRDFVVPEIRTLEERIADRLDPRVEGELKPVRLVEGSTVKEFA